MIFAEIENQRHYSELHRELVAYVQEHFSAVQSGLQGDSWIWITDGDEKVAIDTFTSMKHQIKSPTSGPLVKTVIDTLARHYTVDRYKTPEREPHED